MLISKCFYQISFFLWKGSTTLASCSDDVLQESRTICEKEFVGAKLSSVVAVKDDVDVTCPFPELRHRRRKSVDVRVFLFAASDLHFGADQAEVRHRFLLKWNQFKTNYKNMRALVGIKTANLDFCCNSKIIYHGKFSFVF